MLQFSSLKRYALPIAILSGISLYFLFAFFPPLEPAGVYLSPHMNTLLPSFMFMILFSVFCKVDFRLLRPRPWHATALLLQLTFIMLLTAWLLHSGLSGKSSILGQAVLAVCISPCAGAAPVVVGKLGGRLEEITTYTFLSNLLIALLLPAVFPLFNTQTHLCFLPTFLDILYHVSIILLLPMLSAFIVKRYFHSLHRFILSIRDFGFYMWCLSIMIVSGTTVRNIVHADASSAFLCLIALTTGLVCLLQFGSGRLLGKAFQRQAEIGQAIGQKNTAFAIWAAATYLHPLACVGPGCYILWQNATNAFLIARAESSR